MYSLFSPLFCQAGGSEVKICGKRNLSSEAPLSERGLDVTLRIREGNSKLRLCRKTSQILGLFNPVGSLRVSKEAYNKTKNK
jgi:hypothetical protein